MTRTPRLLSIVVLTVVAIVVPVAPAFAPCHIITFEGDPYSVGEGAGSVTIRVSKNGPQGAPTVDYDTDSDSAEAGSDFEATNGTLVIEDEEAEFKVQITNDSADEPNERFMVRLSNPTDGGCPISVGVQEDTATVTIRDNDEQPSPTPATTKKPKPKASTASPSPSPSPTATSPSPGVSASPIAAPADDDAGGLWSGAVAGIVAAALAVGAGAAYWVRRRFLT